MRIYEQRQIDDEHRLRDHYQKAYSMIPALKELDQSISSLSVEKARRLLDGDSTALSSLKEDLHQLIQRKKSLLEDHGLSEDYLELSYTCPDCKDTGYIGTEKCHCFKKAITDLLYLQSNLQEILDKENFSTFSLFRGFPEHPAVWRYRRGKNFSLPLHRKRSDGCRFFRNLLYSSRII